MSAETKVLYEFGRFRCNPREQLLVCDGKPIPLSPKSFEILLALMAAVRKGSCTSRRSLSGDTGSSPKLLYSSRIPKSPN